MGWDVACKSKGTRWNNAKLANVKVLFTTINYSIGLRSSNTDTSSYLQPSISPSDCVLLQTADVGILGTFTFASLALFHLVPLLLQATSHPILFLSFFKSHPYTFKVFLLKLFTLLVPVTFLITISLNLLVVFYMLDVILF